MGSFTSDAEGGCGEMKGVAMEGARGGWQGGLAVRAQAVLHSCVEPDTLVRMVSRQLKLRSFCPPRNVLILISA